MTRGWRKPADAVYIGRPSRWGNPWRVDGRVITRAGAVERFARNIELNEILDDEPDNSLAGIATVAYPSVEEIRSALAGRDLMCWCPLDKPCHGDVLLYVANVIKPSRPVDVAASEYIEIY